MVYYLNLCANVDGRADLCGSSDTVGVPFFSSHYSSSPSQEINDISTITTGFHEVDGIYTLGTDIKKHITALEEATRLASSLVLNKINGQATAARIRFLVTRTQYTLLSTPKYSNPVHEMCRLVLVLYSESMVNESPPRLPICDVLIANFREIWTTTSDTYNLITPHFKLWSLFVAASVISIFAKPLMDWYLACINETTSKMGVRNWRDLMYMFNTFLWEERVHGKRYMEIWEGAKRAKSHEVEC